MTCANCVYWSANQVKPEDGYEGACECFNPSLAGLKTMATFGCNEFLGEDSTKMNVPVHTAKGTMTDPNPNPLDGPTEVLIVSCKRDLVWLIWALRCMKKYLSGFQGVTVAHPNAEAEHFNPLLERFDIRLHGYHEPEGKGMVFHMAKMASADTFLPAATKYVLTCDSDGMFHTPSVPEHFAWNDKPYWIIRSWDSLVTEDPRVPGSRVISDNMQWRGPTAAQIGFEPDIFAMCMNIQLIPLDLLAAYRAHIEAVQHRNFFEYMTSGRNEFPQDRMDFTAMGAYFFKHHHDRFHWFDVAAPPYPQDRKKAYWSWGGISAEIQKEIESFLDEPKTRTSNP